MLKKTAMALLAAVMSGLSVWAQTVMADKIVAVVGNSAILYSDIVEMSRSIAQERREKGDISDRDPQGEALEILMQQKLLYNQAQVDSVKVHNLSSIPSAVDQRVQQMVKSAGSIQALETLYHKPIYAITQDLHTQMEEQQYAYAMQGEIEDKVKITPGEVEKFFKKIPKDSLPVIPDQYVYAQITKLPPSTAEAKQRAREKLLELRERIIGGTKFELLARMYSEDQGSAPRGGEMDPTPKEGLVKNFGDALTRLKPMQISEVVETEYGFHIIQLLDREDNLYRFRHILVKPSFTDSEIAETLHKLDSVVTLVREGALTFEEAAAKNSDDAYSRLNGGVVSTPEAIEMYQAGAKYTTTMFMRDELPKDDYLALRDMQQGEVSEAFRSQDMRGNVMGKAVKLVRIVSAHNADLKEDYLRLEELAMNAKRNEEFRKWLDKKIGSMYVRIEPEFRRHELFDNRAWIK
jgi:peptidyl-prolyl cis-trans isomerase SurA